MTAPVPFGLQLRRGGAALLTHLRPAVKPLSYGAAGLLVFKGAEGTINAWGAKENPPAQTGEIPYTDPSGKPKVAGWWFDPHTGQSFFFGEPPQPGSDPRRSEERETKTLYWAGAAALVAVGIFAVMRSG